jgi:metallo-beta-lactamase family protein
MVTLSFFGATGTVTGSRYLLEVKQENWLIDCGFFQGKKEDRQKNWNPFPILPSEIHRIFLTHAHLDHAGFLPRLVKQGFRGPVYCTDSTADLLEIMLLDSAHIQEEDAYWANKKGFSKHKPALPLYTTEDAKQALTYIKPVTYGENIHPISDVRVKFRDAGHILGSSFLDFKFDTPHGKRKIVFSGDLGRPNKPILRDTSQAFNVDYLIVESTYGDRLHDEHDLKKELETVLNESFKRNGMVLMPSFAVGRTQTLLYMIRELEEQGRIPSVPVFVDSPMAVDVTEIFRKHSADLNLATRVKKLEGTKIFTPTQLKLCRTRDESKQINPIRGKAIVISASGMATGGRILHHLAQRLAHPENTVVFTGYQAYGTRGRTILEGAKSVKIHGHHIPIKAQVTNLHGFSGHADWREILAWLMGFNKEPKQIFITHGEPEASSSLQEHITQQYGWVTHIPSYGQRFTLDISF